MSDSLEALRQKLSQLEGRLMSLLELSQKDHDIAKRLQRLVVKDRLPKIKGLTCFARHVSGGELSAEVFDFVGSKDGKELYFVASWTPNFGLSSVLLQALIQLETRVNLEEKAGISASDLFAHIEEELMTADKTASFRLAVFRFNLHTLKLELSFKNFPPFLLFDPKEKESPWSFLPQDTSSFTGEAQSDTPVLELDFTVDPGTQIFFISADWNKNARDAGSFYAPLCTEAMPHGGDLLDHTNFLLEKADTHRLSMHPESDLSIVSLEVDPRKIHLA